MSETARLLVVDDKADVRQAVADYLGLHGFSVLTAADGTEMWRRLAEGPVDLVVLDLTMPGEDGLSLARWLRAQGKAGVLILTATAEPIDRVIGLEIGADDYMAKPFLPRELLARVRTILRRMAGGPSAAPAPYRLRVGRCVLDLGAGKLVEDDGSEQVLTGMEFELLKALALHPNQILSRDQLQALAHGRDWNPLDRSIDVRINRLRAKIEPDPRHPQVIRTVRGIGYIFEPGADAAPDARREGAAG